MANAPKISVVMTVYNSEKFITDAVKSILSQTFEDFEFIIVDNNSADRSKAIIASFNDQRVVFIANPTNLGQTKALNIGIRRAKTDLIARMDADDIAMPTRLEKQYRFMSQHPDVAVVGSWCKDIDENGRDQRTYKVVTEPFEIKSHLSASGDLTSWCITHPSVMIRKRVLQEVGLYNEEMSASGYPQDYELWMKIIRHYPMANIPEILLKYRIVGKSESKAFFEKTMAYRMAITESKVKSYVPDLSSDELDSLVRMLEYLPQRSSKEGKVILGLFDRYFKAYMDNDSALKAEHQASKIKLYYLPLLFKTNPGLSLAVAAKIIARCPALIFDPRLYRKMIKSLIRSASSQDQYNFINRKVLAHR